jgi:hypothetical protein
VNEPAPNKAQVDRRVDTLRRLRAAGELPVGWGDGDVSPPDARALELAGLAAVTGERKENRGVPGKSVIRPA